MATWKKVIVSGSNASLADVSASGGFIGDGSALTNLGTLGNALTVDNSTLQVNSGTTYDGGAARTISVKAGGIVAASMAANSIDSDSYVDGSIDTAHIANSQITVGKMAANSVDSAQYVDGSIDPDHLANDAVTAAKLASNAVVNASVASSAAIAFAKLESLPNRKLLVGNADGIATAVALEGDITVGNDGTVTIPADTVTYDKMQDTSTANRLLGATSAGTIGEVQVVVAMMAANSVDSAQYVDGSIDTAHIANSQITVGKMAANSVDSDQYVNGSIDTVHIGANQVTNAKLANDGITIAGADTSLGGSITAATIGAAIGAFSASAQVTGIVVGQMAANSIDSAQYVDGSIDTAHIADSQITVGKMAANSVDSDQYVNGSIDTVHIGDDQVTYAKMQHTSAGNRLLGAASAGAIGEVQVVVGMMAANSVDSAQYVDGSIDTAHIANAQVTNVKLANDGITIAGADTSLGGTVTAATIGAAIGAFSGSAQVTGILVGQMAANSIDSAQYVDGSIDTAHIANSQITAAKMAANSIDSDSYVDGSIDTAHIANSQITVGKMAANSVDSDQYADGSIDPDHLADDAVTAAKLASNAVVNASIAANAAIAHSKLAALASTKVLVGNGSNVATEVVLSGDVAMDNAGEVTIQADSVTYDMMQDTSTANRLLGATSAGTIGEVQVVVAMMAANSVDSAQYVDGSIDTAHIADAQITVGKMAANSVDSDQYVNGSIDTVHIGDNQVTGDKLADSIVIAADLTVTGDLLVAGDTVTVNTANLNVEDQFILINSGSSTATNESGIIFGGSNGAVGAGAALVWNGDYNSNDGRLAIANAVTWNDTSATVSYSVAGVFEGSTGDAATAQADHAGNIRIESDEIYIYV